jgi:hypothetical protein
LSDEEILTQYGARFVLDGSITVFGNDMRTSVGIRNLEDGSVIFSDLKKYQNQRTFSKYKTNW